MKFNRKLSIIYEKPFISWAASRPRNRDRLGGSYRRYTKQIYCDILRHAVMIHIRVDHTYVDTVVNEAAYYGEGAGGGEG